MAPMVSVSLPMFAPPTAHSSGSPPAATKMPTAAGTDSTVMTELPTAGLDAAQRRLETGGTQRLVNGNLDAAANARPGDGAPLAAANRLAEARPFQAGARHAEDIRAGQQRSRHTRRDRARARGGNLRVVGGLAGEPGQLHRPLESPGKSRPAGATRIAAPLVVPMLVSLRLDLPTAPMWSMLSPLRQSLQQRAGRRPHLVAHRRELRPVQQHLRPLWDG